MAMIAGIVGMVIAYFFHRIGQTRFENSLDAMLKDATKRADLSVKEAQITEKEKIIRMRHDLQKETVEAKDRLLKRKRKMEHVDDLTDREKGLAEREVASRTLKAGFNQAKENIKKMANEIKSLEIEVIESLYKKCRLDQTHGKRVLLDNLHNTLNHEMTVFSTRALERVREQQEHIAQQMISTAFQRCGFGHWSPSNSYTLDLQSEEVRARITGPDGELLKLFEEATHTEVSFENFPGVIGFNGNDGTAREIARRAMQKIISKKAVDEMQIKESIDKAEREVNRLTFDEGNRMARELRVTKLHPEIIRMLGRLMFRTSYGQNVLHHSREVAVLAGILAYELGYDATFAKRCAFLHDVGKAFDQSTIGGHPELGAKFIEEYGEHAMVVNAVWAHHDEVEKTSIYPEIVKAADAISGARPGARRETLEHYLERIERLETIAGDFKGVNKSYAIQAGREIRVFVDPHRVNDDHAAKVCKDIAQKIEEECTYPGEIKVTLIRETKVTDYAK